MKLTTRWIWVLAFTGLGAVLGGGWIYRRLTRAAPESVEVRARELVQTIVSSGQVMPPAEVRLDSLLTSTVKQILALAIGIASVLVVSVIQRCKEIGILRAMGVTRAGILRVFLLQGGLIGLVGSLVGCGLGAALSLLFQAALQNADGTPFFPFRLSPQLFASAAGMALVAGVIAAAFPALRASRLDPAEAMRHG